MRERPIPFQPDMSIAVRLDRKTQTRRPIKPKGGGVITVRAPNSGVVEAFGGGAWNKPSRMQVLYCPYGQVGDVLWVREAWRAKPEFDKVAPRDIPHDARIYFEADGPADARQWGRLRPPMFMPRWMCRTRLELLRVWAERLNDITGADAVAEGIPRGLLAEEPDEVEVGKYGQLWDRIHGPGSWAANPWVWALEFRRLTP